MKILLGYGFKQLELDLPDDTLVFPSHTRRATAVDPTDAVRAALEAPLRFPALRRALTPDDHIAIVLDEQLPHLVPLLVPLLEHIVSAGVSVGSITLVCAANSREQHWIDDLPDEFQDVRVEVHAPDNRRRLSYLASTKGGHRLYFNTKLVDAEQIVVLTGRGYDATGYSGGTRAVYPTLGDENALRSWNETTRKSTTVGELSAEAQEACSLLGNLFFVQAIEGIGDTVVRVVAGMADTTADAEKYLDSVWKISSPPQAKTVLASVGGNLYRHDFAVCVRALSTAMRLVEPGGSVILVTDAGPTLPPSVEVLRRGENPEESLALLRKLKTPDQPLASAWAEATRRAHVYLKSGLPDELVEEMHATPLQNEKQIQRLLQGVTSCVVLEDAHKMSIA